MTYLNSETEGFVMDDLGNRTGIQTLRGGGTDDYLVDSLTNRYTAIDASPLGYDAAGNLTQDKDGYVYGYDYENRIVEIRSGADALIAKMDYDTQGRRIRVRDAAAGTETLYYYSDQWQVLAKYTSSGTQQAYYVYGNYIDEKVKTCRAVGAQHLRRISFRGFASPATNKLPLAGQSNFVFLQSTSDLLFILKLKHPQKGVKMISDMHNLLKRALSGNSSSALLTAFLCEFVLLGIMTLIAKAVDSTFSFVVFSVLGLLIMVTIAALILKCINRRNQM